MTDKVNQDVAAIEAALAAGPTHGDWLVEGTTVYALTGARRPTNIFTGQFTSARQPHEAQANELAANAELCAAANPARMRRILDVMAQMATCLEQLYDGLVNEEDSDDGVLRRSAAALAAYRGRKQ